MVKERKAIGRKAMVGHPIAQATGIKTWPEASEAGGFGGVCQGEDE